MLKLSIIIPLYNSEKYIRKCLDSVLNQDIPHNEYEIIVVNDGSPDNSAEIVSTYIENFSNIKLIHQDNQGTSGARNTGIDNAKGKYMVFVDPDDFVEPSIYKILLEKMEFDNLDMLRTDYTMVDENYNFVSKPKGTKNMSDYTDEIVDGEVFLSEKLGFACFVWVFVYKSELIKSNDLYFQKGFYIDDTEWLPRVLCKASKVSSIDKATYFYVQREGSLMRTNNATNLKRLEASLKAVDMLLSRSKEQSDNKIKSWYLGMNTVIVLSILEILSQKLIYNKAKYLNILKKFEVFPLSTYGHSEKLIKKIKLINLSPSLYVWIVGLIKN